MPAPEPMLTATFRDRADASQAHSFLLQRGFDSKDINVLMSDATRQSFNDDPPQAAKNLATEGVATGGAIGTGIGASLAAIAAIGTTVIFPGAIVVAGPLLAALAGGGAGAVAGGVIGGLIGAGLPESNAKAYEEVLKSGGVVLGVVPRNSDDRIAIKERFAELKGENIVNASI